MELIIGHLRYHLTGVMPQPNAPPDNVFCTDGQSREATLDPATNAAPAKFPA